MKLWFLAVILLAGLLDGQTRFVPANVAGHDLRLFPKDGQATVINIQFPVWIVKFASYGRSLYASLPIDQRTKLQPCLVRIDLNPIEKEPSKNMGCLRSQFLLVWLGAVSAY